MSGCTGKARESIRNCIMEPDPERGYQEARGILDNRFGQMFNVIKAHLEKLTGGPKVKPSDVEALIQLAQDMKDCEITCRGRDSAGLNSQQTIGDVFRRLPTYLQEKFTSQASAQMKKGDPVTFSQLTEFVQRAAYEKNSFLGQIMSERGEASKETGESWESGGSLMGSVPEEGPGDPTTKQLREPQLVARSLPISQLQLVAHLREALDTTLDLRWCQ